MRGGLDLPAGRASALAFDAAPDPLPDAFAPFPSVCVPLPVEAPSCVREARSVRASDSPDVLVDEDARA